MKFRLTALLLLFHCLAFGQTDSAYFIKVHFLYGSKPLREHQATERKHFGGLHGGHVTIQSGDLDYGFRRTNKRTHIFPFKNRASTFVTRELKGQSRYGPGRKTATFIIPISPQQHAALQQIHTEYLAATPYDYAFFGMRCASATQEILGDIGVVKNRKRFFNIATAFYPKRLRKRLFRLAQKHNYEIIQTEGRPTRKWERD